MRPVAVLSVMVNAKGVGSTRAGLRAVQGQLVSTGNAGERMGKQIAAGAKWASLGVGVGLGFAVKKAADFEQQIDSLGSVTEASGRQMDQFRKQAMKAGAATKFSALDAAVAQTELAKGGLSVRNILKGGLRSALALAAAGEMDLGDAASTTANAMNLFGLEGKKSMKVADALAKAANATTADVSDFAMALQQGGSVAKSAGLSFNETVLALEALAKSGIKNADAGTSLKTSLIQLLKPTAKQAELADKLNLSFLDQQGHFKGLADVSQMLRGRLGDMTKAQRTATLATLAGTDGVRTLTALYDAGPERLRKWSKGLGESGTAAEVAARKQDNLKGKLENLQGSIETIAIGVGSKLIPALSDAAVAINKILNDPKLTTGQKFDRLTGMISNAINQGLKKATELAIQYGPKIAAALATGFLSWWSGANPIAKILGLAAIIRLLGGKGAITASGLAIGRWLGGGITAGATTATVAGAAGGGAGAGAAGGILGGLVTKLKGIAPRAGIAAVGILLADQLMKNFSNGVAAKSGDIQKEIKQLTDPGLAGSIIEKTFGESDVTVAGKALSKSLAEIAAKSKAISPAKAEELRKQLELLGDVTPKARHQFDQLVNTAEKRFHDGAQATAFFNHAISDMVRDSKGKLGGMATNVAFNTNLIKKALKDDSGAGRRALSANMGGILSTIRATMSRGGKITGEGMGLIKQLFINELLMYGLSPRQALAGANLRTGDDVGGHRRQDFQRGGSIVPGTGSGDKVPLHLAGRHVANVEPGELVSVANRNATSALMQMNSAVPRFQGGGIAGMVAAANQLEAAHFPYKWGGGHQASPAPFGPMDCSGAVSYVLQHGGVQIPTMVSGALAGAGKPGPGAVTVFANSGHTFMRLGQRYFGTSGSNPNGGAGWFPDPGAGYRSGFAQRHFVGGAFKPIPEVVVGGRDSALRSSVQGAISGDRRAANKRLRHVMLTPMGSGDSGDPGPFGDRRTRSRGTGRTRSHGFQKGGIVGWPHTPINIAADAARRKASLKTSDLINMVAIAGRESSWNPRAQNLNASTGDHSIGLWQINQLAHHGRFGSDAQLMIPDVNAKAMGSLFHAAGYSPWHSMAGATQFLDGARRAVSATAGAGGPAGKSPVDRLTKGQRKKLKHPFTGPLGNVLTKTLKVLRTSDSAKFRGGRLRQFEKRLRKFGLPSKLTGALALLSKSAETWGDYADRAGQLNVDNGDGTTTLGVFKGKGEATWLTDQLEVLFKWRNKLVDAIQIIQKRRREVAHLIVRAQKRLKKVADQVRSTAGVRRGLQHQLDVAKKHPKKNATLIADLKGKIGKIDAAQKPRVRERKLLQDRIIPALTGRRKALGEQYGTFTGTDGLEQVQGPGGPLGHLKTLPGLGTLGGSIFDVQLRLRDLAAPAGAKDNSPVTDDATVDMLRQLLQQSNLRAAVSETYFKTLGDFKIPGVPYLGAFAKGGVFLAGERGPELVHTAASSGRVYNAGDTQQLMQPKVDVKIIHHGDGQFEVHVNDRQVEAAVERVTRRQAQRGSRLKPGAGGGSTYQ